MKRWKWWNVTAVCSKLNRHVQMKVTEREMQCIFVPWTCNCVPKDEQSESVRAIARSANSVTHASNSCATVGVWHAHNATQLRPEWRHPLEPGCSQAVRARNRCHGNGYRRNGPGSSTDPGYGSITSSSSSSSSSSLSSSTNLYVAYYVEKEQPRGRIKNDSELGIAIRSRNCAQCALKATLKHSQAM